MEVLMPQSKRIVDELEVKDRPIDKWIEKYGYHGYIQSHGDGRHFVLEVKQANFLYDPPVPDISEEETNKFYMDLFESDLGWMIPGVTHMHVLQYNLPIGEKRWIEKGDLGYDKVMKELNDITYGYRTDTIRR